MSVVERALVNASISYRVIEHRPVYTVTESKEHMPDAYPVKNLFLEEEKGNRRVFVIMKGDERLDTKRIASELRCKKLRFAKPEVLMDCLGVEPGSASLFSLLYQGSSLVEVVIDSRLLDQKEVGFHPSENTKTIFIAGSAIKTFLGSINRRHVIREL